MPDLLTASIFLVMGLVLLVKGADLFVEAAAKIAKVLGISEFIIGLTLIALGTSLPELSAGVVASYADQTEIVLGNVLGSNIANIALILGLSAFIAPMATQKEMFYRDGVMLVVVSLVFYYFAFDGAVDSVEGIILLFLFFLYTAHLLKFRPRIPHFQAYVDFLYDLNLIAGIEEKAHLDPRDLSAKTPARMMRGHVKAIRGAIRAGRRAASLFDLKRIREYRQRIRSLREYRERLKESFAKDLSLLVISGGAIYLGAEYLVGSAADLAGILGIGPSIIGLTVVSIGTSLPELAVSLQSARKGFNQMVIGNVLGSNIANITLVIGLCSLITPVSLGVSPELQHINIYFIIPFMWLVSFMGFIAIRSNWSIRRFEGAFFLLLYLFFLFWLMSTPAILS